MLKFYNNDVCFLGYQTSNEHEKLLSVFMMLRHFNGFFNAICEAIKIKGEDAADIEHLFAQVRFFSGNPC